MQTRPARAPAAERVVTKEHASANIEHLLGVQLKPYLFEEPNAIVHYHEAVDQATSEQPLYHIVKEQTLVPSESAAAATVSAVSNDSKETAHQSTYTLSSVRAASHTTTRSGRSECSKCETQ